MRCVSARVPDLHESRNAARASTPELANTPWRASRVPRVWYFTSVNPLNGSLRKQALTNSRSMSSVTRSNGGMCEGTVLISFMAGERGSTFAIKETHLILAQETSCILASCL
jgi:hypothetical protein